MDNQEKGIHRQMKRCPTAQWTVHMERFAISVESSIKQWEQANGSTTSVPGKIAAKPLNPKVDERRTSNATHQDYVWITIKLNIQWNSGFEMSLF